MLWWFGWCVGTPERRGVEKTDHEEMMQPARSKTLCNKRPRPKVVPEPSHFGFGAKREVKMTKPLTNEKSSLLGLRGDGVDTTPWIVACLGR